MTTRPFSATHSSTAPVRLAGLIQEIEVRKKYSLAASVAAALMLAACGGGGGGGSAASGSTTGLWNGTTSTGATVSALVFPSGEAWAAYVNGGTIGFVKGTINGAATDFNITAGTRASGTITGTAVTKQSISGTAGTATYSGTYDAAFEQTPSLAAAAGTYTGTGPSAGATITVTTGGAVTGAGATCTVTGTATPRADGNAFNVSITYAGGACPAAGQTLAGIAYYNAAAKSLTSAVVNAGSTVADIFIGTKP